MKSFIKNNNKSKQIIQQNFTIIIQLLIIIYFIFLLLFIIQIIFMFSIYFNALFNIKNDNLYLFLNGIDLLSIISILFWIHSDFYYKIIKIN